MKNRHKYFRNQRYKHSLEIRYTNINAYMGPEKFLVFITSEPDLKVENSLYYYKESRGCYIYLDRPNIPYTLICKNCHNRSKRKKIYRNYCNRKFRKNNQKWLNSSNRAMYKKVNEYWWNIY